MSFKILQFGLDRFQEPYLYKNSRSTIIRAALGAQILVLREI
jgi:hypothetical protein